MLSSIRIALVSVAISAAQVVGAFSFDYTSAENLANESLVETNALVIDLEQVASVYRPDSAPLSQRTERELSHTRKYILVGVKNLSPTPLRGRIRVIGKWHGGVLAVIDVHYLPGGMDQYDYFILPEYGILADYRTTKPELEVEWIDLRRVPPRECKKMRKE